MILFFFFALKRQEFSMAVTYKTQCPTCAVQFNSSLYLKFPILRTVGQGCVLKTVFKQKRAKQHATSITATQQVS